MEDNELPAANDVFEIYWLKLRLLTEMDLSIL